MATVGVKGLRIWLTGDYNELWVWPNPQYHVPWSSWQPHCRHGQTNSTEQTRT